MKKSIIGAILLIIIIVSCSCNKAMVDENFLSGWMQYISDDVKIIDVVIPGSHDAGSKGLLFNMETQGSTIAKQLDTGVRYFDFRVKYNFDNELSIYHGVQTGILFSSILTDLKNFIDNNPTEFLIIDFQHMEADTDELLIELQIDVETAFNNAMNPESFALKNDVNLTELTMGKIRELGARYIIVWGRNEPSVLAKEYIFLRENALYSPYEKPEHQADWDRLMNYFPNYYAVNDNTRFFVLQSQPTSGDLAEFNELYLCDMNAYVDSLAINAEILNKTNIIMRDFIAEDIYTVPSILRLNLAKGNISKEYVEMFMINTKN